MSLARVNQRRHHGALAWVGVLAMVAFSATPPRALAQSGVSQTYRIVAGDVLGVDVTGRPDLSGQFTVTKDGNIRISGLGNVPAGGRTTTELGNDISRRVSLISREIPQVVVTVLQTFRRKNFVLGAVLLPGAYTFEQPPTLWEAISQAGGAADDADLSAVQVISEASPAPTVIDLAAAHRSGNLGSLPRLAPGETIRVPRTARAAFGGGADVVYVFGAVGAQGPQPLAEATDLVQALIRSGPSLDADYGNVKIVRRSGTNVVSMRIDVNEYFGKGILAGNPGLQSGDTIHLSRKGESSVPKVLRAFGVALGVLASISVLTN